MNKDSFATYFAAIAPSDELIEATTRTFLSEFTADLLPQYMKQEMLEKIGNSRELESALSEFEQSHTQRRDACIFFLEWAWMDKKNRPRIEGAFAGTSSKLPVVEFGVLAIVAMYGMYLIATEGKSKEIREITRNFDGSTKQSTKIYYHSPASVLATIPKLFAKLPGVDKLLGSPDDDSPQKP